MQDYEKSIKQVLKDQSVDPKKGLSAEEVLKRQEEFGLNELREKKTKNIVANVFVSVQ